MRDQHDSAADVPHDDLLEMFAGYADDELSSEDRARVAKELPSAVGGADAVSATVGLEVKQLEVPDAHLVAAWITEIRGKPTAALAYRWHGHIIVQYVVPEGLFFQQPSVREAAAAGRARTRRRTDRWA